MRPLAAGRLSTGHNVKLGHLSQHADELGRGAGARARTVIEACGIHTGLPPQKARALLGRFLFSGEEAEKPLDGLSGGERRRLSLAILVASGANVLILDEPTNHLDLESREALEDALLAFEGALLLVSHDRALLEAVGTRTVAVLDGTLRSYDGGWQEFLRVREEKRLAERAPKKAQGRGAPAPAPATAKPPKASPRRSAAAGRRQLRGRAARRGDGGRARRRRQRQRRRSAGRAAVEERAPAHPRARARDRAGRGRRSSTLEAELAEPDAWSTPERTAQSTERHAAAKRAVEEAFARWEVAAS